jgi:hypothetical protein
MMVTDAEISRIVQKVTESPIDIGTFPFIFVIVATGAVFAYLYKGIYAWGHFRP